MRVKQEGMMKKLFALALCAGLLGPGAAWAQDIGPYDSKEECLETADTLEELHGTRMFCAQAADDGLWYLHAVTPGAARPKILKRPRAPQRPR